MTISSVKSDLDAIGQLIAGSANARNNAHSALLAARNQLAAITTIYADTITEINNFTPTGAFEALAKDEKAKLASEFTALKTAIESDLTALGVSFS